MAARIRSELSRRTVLGTGLGLALTTPLAAQEPLVVLAAASLKPALDEVAESFPQSVALSYGGSGTIARQAARGAPADAVLLAATDWMDWLAGQGVLDGDPIPLAGNRLILAAPPGAAPLPLTAEAIDARLEGGRFAMGDPLSVPAGRYGQQALETLGLWAHLRGRAILAENVRAALAYVARGDVALGLVYGSDAVGTGVVDVAQFPPDTHSPIVYPGALLRGARPGARGFLEAVAGSGPVFARHGFAPRPAA
ncbi:molybdate ABC transporter substrate-binding protein [Jannaschia seohaensis]|uniref:Molybdate transport system substrate-binding protein n=1 Tax=Jannaschia seohaensis TaxID=475081 RepID=A0A2Y9C7K4_9RHOB|nr:molybdate ABC transporter substrate-binding protein [Jannaschia seohaensis]PWJ19241.1 molybdate transport system substrate-binding protein [Jannaschia seohaensis]SSA45903.1 molybdate transport system substrate-binding protein [Jannaschia seohaensis]